MKRYLKQKCIPLVIIVVTVLAISTCIYLEKARRFTYVSPVYENKVFRCDRNTYKKLTLGDTNLAILIKGKDTAITKATTECATEKCLHTKEKLATLKDFDWNQCLDACAKDSVEELSNIDNLEEHYRELLQKGCDVK